VSYIDAGYAIALSVLTLYGVVLWSRRHRLESWARGARERRAP
jgi:hypothetical protein